MSKNKNASEVLGTEENNSVVLAKPFYAVTTHGEQIDFESAFSDPSGFQTSGCELLGKEMLEDLRGLKDVRALMRKKTMRTLKGEHKEGIEMDIQLADGVKTVWTSVFRFLSTFDECDKGNGVLIQFTVGEKETLKNGRTMNKIDIVYKAL